MPLFGLIRRQRNRFTLGLCIGASLFLLLFADGSSLSIARALAGFVYVPADGAQRLAVHIARLGGENEKLREQLMGFADQHQRALEYKREAEDLRRLLAFRETESYHFLPAELLSYPMEARERDLLRIDRGHEDGALIGMPVVSPEGLVGAVFDVQAHQATVRLLASKDFAVSCRDRRSRVLGVFRWDPRRGYHVDRVDLGEDVVVGDRFMTSGLGERFPGGLLLGTAYSVKETPGELRKEILIEPAAPLKTLQSVFVMTEIGPEATGFPLPDSADEPTP